MNVLAPKQLEGALMKSQDTRRKAAKAAERLADAADHVDRALAQWSREMPDVEIKGAGVLNRAQRIVLESRPGIEAIPASSTCWRR